jgi:hypothetical protein
MSQLLATITVDGTATEVQSEVLLVRIFTSLLSRECLRNLDRLRIQGKIGVKFGNLTLTNDYLNASHPFALQTL